MFEHRSHRRLPSRLSLLLALSVAFLACDSDNPTQPVVDETPDAPRMTETFSGSIGQLEISCHVFTVVESGNTILTLTDLQPLPTLTVGLSLGQPDPDNPGACLISAQDTNVKVAEMLLSAGVGGVDYCACVVDVGNIFPDQTVDYELEVDHT